MRHKLSAFVDDSTFFLQEAQQIPRVLRIVEEFGPLSGSKVQPAKSILIFLNSAVARGEYCGIPVLGMEIRRDTWVML